MPIGSRTPDGSLTFRSGFDVGRELPQFTDDAIKNEPMLFSCDVEHALKLGGPITRAFVEAARLHEDAVIDTRSHMLMPGWWPCIPGWHHDDVPREREDKQPEYDTPSYEARHIMALVNGDICPTQFAVGIVTVPAVPLGETIYRAWHPVVEDHVANGKVQTMPAPSCRLIYFDAEAFHQGTRAISFGWRWFGRISTGTHRKATNEIRRQVQVYLDSPMEGW